MVLLFSMGCVTIALYGYYKTKFLLNPVTAMFIVWGLILPFSCWGAYDTVIPSDKVYIIIFIGLIAFLIGTLLGMQNIEYKWGLIHTSNRWEYKFNYGLIYVLGIVAIIYYILQLIVVIGLLKAGFDYNYIRELAVTTEDSVLTSSPIVTIIKAFIAVPMTYLSLTFLPLELLKKNKNKIIIIGSILLMLFYVLTTGGRSVIMWFLLYFVCVFMMRGKNAASSHLKQIIRKHRFIMIIGGVALIWFLLQMTFARKGDDVDLLKQAYIYFVAPLPNLDHHIGLVDNSHLYGYGLSSFYGLLYPFMFILSNLGIEVFTPFVDTIYNMSFQDLQMGVNIGNGIYMNAFVTAFYQPYLDGRYLGVILIMALFGFASGRFFYKAYYKNNVKCLLIYLLLLQKIMFSFVRFYFTQQAQSICFILALIVIVKSTSKDDEDKIIRW